MKTISTPFGSFRVRTDAIGVSVYLQADRTFRANGNVVRPGDCFAVGHMTEAAIAHTLPTLYGGSLVGKYYADGAKYPELCDVRCTD